MQVDRLTLAEGENTLARLTLLRNGQPQSPPQATWVASDTGVVSLETLADGRARITALRPGTAAIIARAGGLSASAIVAVVRASGNGVVASVTIEPSSLDLAVGDSVGVRAVARDAEGRILAGRSFAWSSTEPQVALLHGFGEFGIVRALRAGSATITATADGRTGSSAVVVR
jgi:uncharacterized protein YjdB